MVGLLPLASLHRCSPFSYRKCLWKAAKHSSLIFHSHTRVARSSGKPPRTDTDGQRTSRSLSKYIRHAEWLYLGLIFFLNVFTAYLALLHGKLGEAV